MSRLTVIVVARHPSQQIVELLGSLRSAADELIVAVDDRAGTEGLGALEPLADTLAVFRFDQAIERQWAWIASLATCEWILWLDDDELPSPALIAALPALVGATDVTHYHLRRRWLWPSPGSSLAEPPWEPEFIPRLFRSDQALVWYPGRFHLPVKQAGPFRWVDEPLYHLDLVLNQEAHRRDKAARYEQLRPGMRIAGRPLNEAFYVPEGRTPEPRTAPLPAADRDAVERFIRCSSSPFDGMAPARPVLRGTKNLIDELYRGVDGDHEEGAAVELVGPVEPINAGIERPLEVRVENRGSTWWPADVFAVSDIFVSYSWYRPDGSIVVGERTRTPMPVSVPPGGSERLVIALIPPSVPGRYVLGVDVLHEHVRWFECEQRKDVHVGRVPVVGVLVDPADRLVALEVASRLTEDLPQARLELLVRDPAATAAATGYPCAPDPTAVVLEEASLPLLVSGLGPSLRRSEQAGAQVDVLVIAGTNRLAGASGHREGLALAATMRRLHSRGTPLVTVGDTLPAARGLLGRMTKQVISLADQHVVPASPEGIAEAVAAALDAATRVAVASELP